MRNMLTSKNSMAKTRCEEKCLRQKCGFKPVDMWDASLESFQNGLQDSNLALLARPFWQLVVSHVFMHHMVQKQRMEADRLRKNYFKVRSFRQGKQTFPTPATSLQMHFIRRH